MPAPEKGLASSQKQSTLDRVVRGSNTPIGEGKTKAGEKPEN